MEFLFQLALVFLLVFLNGYFVASEFALVSVRKSRIAELAKKGNKSAQLIQTAIDDLDNYISATQLGITLASLALGWIGEPAVAHFIEPFFSFLPETISFLSAHTISIAIAFTFITFLHIVLGELTPKSIALEQAEKTSLFVIGPLILFAKIFKPFIWFLNSCGQMVLRASGIKPSENASLYSEDELKLLLRQSSTKGLIPAKEVEIVLNAFKLGDIPVKVVMIPRTEIVALDRNITLLEATKKIDRHPHSRFPVFETSIDNIVGFVHIKDLYRTLLKKGSKTKLSEVSIIRKILFVPEVKKIDRVLQDMRRKQIHIAIVNDEFGGTAGVLALEDIIESLVGEIDDEFDNPVKDILRQKDGTYLVEGSTLIESIQDRFHLPLKGQGYTTIGGLVFGLLGHEPQKSDSVEIGNWELEVLEIEGKRIAKLLFKKIRPLKLKK